MCGIAVHVGEELVEAANQSGKHLHPSIFHALEVVNPRIQAGATQERQPMVDALRGQCVFWCVVVLEEPRVGGARARRWVETVTEYIERTEFQICQLSTPFTLSSHFKLTHTLATLRRHYSIPSHE